MNQQALSPFLWSVDDILRSDYKQADFGKVTVTAETAITLLQERRAALLSAAVTGKIDVRHLSPAATEAA